MKDVTPVCAPAGTLLIESDLSYWLNGHRISTTAGRTLELSPTRSKWNAFISTTQILTDINSIRVIL